MVKRHAFSNDQSIPPCVLHSCSHLNLFSPKRSIAGLPYWPPGNLNPHISRAWPKVNSTRRYDTYGDDHTEYKRRNRRRGKLNTLVYRNRTCCGLELSSEHVCHQRRDERTRICWIHPEYLHLIPPWFWCTDTRRWRCFSPSVSQPWQTVSEVMSGDSCFMFDVPNGTGVLYAQCYGGCRLSYDMRRTLLST